MLLQGRGRRFEPVNAHHPGTLAVCEMRRYSKGFSGFGETNTACPALMGFDTNRHVSVCRVVTLWTPWRGIETYTATECLRCRIWQTRLCLMSAFIRDALTPVTAVIVCCARLLVLPGAILVAYRNSGVAISEHCSGPLVGAKRHTNAPARCHPRAEKELMAWVPSGSFHREHRSWQVSLRV